MEEFVESLSTLKPSLPFMEMDQGFELMSHFEELISGNVMENPIMGLSNNDSYLSQQLGFPAHFVDNLLGMLPLECPKPISGSQLIGQIAENGPTGEKKRKAKSAPEASSENSSGIPTERMKTEEKPMTRNSTAGSKKKKGRSNSKEVEKPMEVVHVRARRGQATDSHSLAERVRREKINERMRCLQDLVPGCYKTMGMAGMLDEIINYVQSLQNQVEFLSMKLSTASTFYDFSMDNNDMATAQVDNVYETQELERLMREGYGGCTSFHSTKPF